MHHEVVLKELAGQTVDIAIAIYKLEKRKPNEIIRID